jgi:hypothetical protein
MGELRRPPQPEYTLVCNAGRPLQMLAGRVYLQRVVMDMPKRLEYQKMSDYRPKLPSNNAYDYYIAAARQLKAGEGFSGQQPPTPQERRWIEANQGAFNTLRGAFGKPYQFPFEPITSEFYADEYASLRNLARLVNARIRWAIAVRDGTDAVHDWRIGFQMARHLQGDTTPNYLVGAALEATIHAPILRSVDFFSAHECREMAQTLIQSERSRDRFATAIEGELTMALRELDRMLPERTDEARAAIEPLLNEALTDIEGEEDRRTLERLQDEFQSLFNQPSAYQRLRAELRRVITQGLASHRGRCVAAWGTLPRAETEGIRLGYPVWRTGVARPATASIGASLLGAAHPPSADAGSPNAARVPPARGTLPRLAGAAEPAGAGD